MTHTQNAVDYNAADKGLKVKRLMRFVMILINVIDLFEQYLSAYTKHFKCRDTHKSVKTKPLTSFNQYPRDII